MYSHKCTALQRRPSCFIDCISYAVYMVEKPPLSNKIQKTITSRTALIGVAAATMMITVTMIGAIQLQQASAAKPIVRNIFCYDRGEVPVCSLVGMKVCHDAQRLDDDATSRCYPQHRHKN